MGAAAESSEEPLQAMMIMYLISILAINDEDDALEIEASEPEDAGLEIDLGVPELEITLKQKMKALDIGLELPTEDEGLDIGLEVPQKMSH